MTLKVSQINETAIILRSHETDAVVTKLHLTNLLIVFVRFVQAWTFTESMDVFSVLWGYPKPSVAQFGTQTQDLIRLHSNRDTN